RKGIAREACEAVILYGVNELNVSKVIVRIEKDNEKSKNLAYGLGFQMGVST
ncbi:MAG: GNAT family N-acetyltransferase, partial [Lachnospiraceae bacterium]|nr:GNAT family N-acetyltransferase [Lachnospiraceae bacterium]